MPKSLQQSFNPEVTVEQNGDKILKVAAALHIRVDEVEEALRVQSPEICTATTEEAAREAYFESLPGSPTQENAFYRWVELASSVEEVRRAYENAPHFGDLRVIAYLKWVQFIEEMIEKVTSPEEAKKVYETAPKGSDIQALVLAKWVKMIQSKVDSATTLSEIDEACRQAPRHTGIETAALLKKIDLLLQELTEATTPEEAEVILHSAPHLHSEVWQKALSKWVETAKEASVLEYLYQRTPIGSYTMVAIIKRVYQLMGERRD